MVKVLDYYEINQRTMALLSVEHMDYCTIVLEVDRQLYVNVPTTKLVKASCIDGGATYDGRRKAVTYRTGSKQKVPIPINPLENIFAFPTQSPKSFHCNWIFYNHVKHIRTFTSPKDKTTQARIIFKNGQQITFRESQYVLEKQMMRTAICILLFSSRTVRP